MLSAERDRVIEVCAAIVKGGQILRSFERLVNPGVRVTQAITSLTGITNEMVQGKLTTEVVFRDLAIFVESRPILAHNASFDRRFYYAEMKRTGVQEEAKNTFLCSLLLCRRFLHDLPNHKLANLKGYLGFEESQSHQDHRAASDVAVTVCLWSHLCDVIQKSNIMGVLRQGQGQEQEQDQRHLPSPPSPPSLPSIPPPSLPPSPSPASPGRSVPL